MPGFFSISSASISELGIVSTGIDGNASGSLVNITVVTLDGSSIGSAEASSSLVTVSTSSQDGSASGSATVSTASNIIQINSQDGSATAFADAQGGLQTITIQAQSGSASVSSSASGSLATTTITASTGSATGGANGITGLDPVLLVPPTGTIVGDASISPNFQTVSTITLDGSGSGSGSASGQAFPTIPISFIVQGSSSALGDGLLGNFTPGDYQQNFSSAFGTANASAEFVSVAVIHLDGSAEARNPPAWARPRVFSIVTATSSVKLSTTNNAARIVVPIN